MPCNQSKFRAALLDPARPVPHGLTDGAGQPTTKRFAVYRNNVTVALTDALSTGFPVLRKLLGSQKFGHLALVFVRAHPPSSPLMMHYGAEMPVFLSTLAPLSHIEYLPDVARFEIALRASYHARDAPPFDAAQLGMVEPDALMRATLGFTPATKLVQSVWPLFDIWRFNTQADAPKPRAIVQPVLITRAVFDPIPHALTPAQAHWVHAMQNGATFGGAQDAACTIDPNFDLSPLLTLLVQHTAIGQFNAPKDDAHDRSEPPARQDI